MAEYKCTLSDFYQQKAKDELGEDPKNRTGAIETFRNWLNTQKHIRCPKDAEYILRYLRVTKFSQLVAREYLTNYLTLIEKRPEYFCNVDMSDQKIQDFLDSGYVLFPEKRDPQGRQFVIMRPAMLDHTFKTYDKVSVYKAMVGVMTHFQSKEENQVSGFSYFIDLSDFSLAQSKVWTLDDMKFSGSMWNKCFPGRFKEFHYYNHGAVFEAMFDIFKNFITKKMKDRIQFHGSNMEAIYKVVPKECLPLEYLPDDYTGPNAGSMQQMTETLKNTFLDGKVRERILYETDPKVSGIDLAVASASDAPQESFRRLNID